MLQVRVASLSVRPRGDTSERLQQVGNLIERAGQFRPDFVILPEYSLSTIQTPDTVPGLIVDTMAEHARDLRSHIILPFVHQTDEGYLYNSAFWIDRTGEISGVYRKMFPTDYEMVSGLVPGESTPVFATDVARIGMAICFDLNFNEVAQGLGTGGAELVFFMSAYEGGRQLARWALDWGFYVVSAHRDGNGHVIDKTGRLLQSSTADYPLLVRTLNLDREVFHLDYNRKHLEKISERYGAGIEIEIYTAEGIFALESRMDEVTVADISREFGLETFTQYIQRSRQARQDRLAGRSVEMGIGGP